MHKRTTPEVFAHAKELRRELTPLERKLWARLRAHRMKGVHFRAQHAIGNYVVDFPLKGRCAPRAKDSLSNWTVVNIWIKQSTML
jgi:very-short-patch-repair endonuclease